MAAVCPKIQNGGQNVTFWPNENMTLYTTSYCDWSVYFDVCGYKEYIFVVFKIQNGRHIQENPKWPLKWCIIWLKYSYGIIHHQSFELKCLSVCVYLSRYFLTCLAFCNCFWKSKMAVVYLKIQNGVQNVTFLTKWWLYYLCQ